MILDGLKEQQKLRQAILRRVDYLKNQYHIQPKLVVILIGHNTPSLLYVSKKKDFAHSVGIQTEIFHLPTSVSLEECLTLIHQLNTDPRVHGILLQLPLPPHLSANTLIETILPSKDVDGLHSTNVGKLIQKEEGLYPCTPQGCLHLIRLWQKDLKGLTAVVIGRSLLVGKPMAALLLHANATVIQTHRYTKNLKDLTCLADIVVVAAGHPGLISSEFIKEGACVIDVGISKNQQEQIVGDVIFEEVKNKASSISPVPGGVGPMTVTYLMMNILKSCCIQEKISYEECSEL